MTNKDLYIEIGSAIKNMRESKNISKEKASEMLLMSTEKYVAIEEGREEVLAGDLFLISHAFNTTVYDLLKEIN